MYGDRKRRRKGKKEVWENEGKGKNIEKKQRGNEEER